MNTSISLESLSIVAKALGASESSLRQKSVSGGYSANRRSIVRLEDTWVFVKEVDTSLLSDDGTKELSWLQKEHDCIQSLRAIVPELVPEWSQLLANGKVLILPAYQSENGWLWSPPNDPEIQLIYIQSVIDAVKKLESIHFDDKDIEKLRLQPFLRDELTLDSGLSSIMESGTTRSQLKEKYQTLVRNEKMVKLLSDDVALQSLSDRAVQLTQQPNAIFGHCDVRSDNIAFHPETRAVKFVDWNWSSITPKGFGATEFLIDMGRRGLTTTPWQNELNPEMLAATVGFYAQRGLKEPHILGSNLRTIQAESAAVAYELYLSTLYS